MSTQTIDQPFVAGNALRSVNFFNGRLLTGDDLSREQATQETRLHRVGRAVGSGVATGFEVVEALASSTHARPVVTVSAGLALSRSGIALELPADVDVSLYSEDPSPTAEPGALFADCQPFAPGTYTAGAGVYVLTVGPAEVGEGRAPVNGLGNDTGPCTIALEAEALRFRLIRLALPAEVPLSDKAHLRNRVAYLCFGEDTLAGAVADPFGSPVTTYGLLDTLRTQTMTDDEVPLATIGWTVDDGIEFVDLWSVRRRLTRPAPEGDWASLTSDRQRAEGEAMFLQFQQQILDLGQLGTEAMSAAEDTFDFLPPVGLLALNDSSHPHGFDPDAFFTGVKTRPGVIPHVNGARVEALVSSALAFPPIDLTIPDETQRELVWRYVVRENKQLLLAQAESYVLFASGHVPYAANAQFDLAHWNFANFSIPA
jgi:hypothetical protein